MKACCGTWVIFDVYNIWHGLNICDWRACLFVRIDYIGHRQYPDYHYLNCFNEQVPWALGTINLFPGQGGEPAFRGWDIKENHNIKRKSPQKLYDENIWREIGLLCSYYPSLINVCFHYVVHILHCRQIALCWCYLFVGWTVRRKIKCVFSSLIFKVALSSVVMSGNN